MEEGEELVVEPFQRLIARRELYGVKYDGFWTCMDTFKDKQRLEDLVARGETPWEVWKEPPPRESKNGDVAAAPLLLARQRPR
jgi:glucose-1-phosphate cytidylyltransferase